MKIGLSLSKICQKYHRLFFLDTVHALSAQCCQQITVIKVQNIYDLKIEQKYIE